MKKTPKKTSRQSPSKVAKTPVAAKKQSQPRQTPAAKKSAAASKKTAVKAVVVVDQNILSEKIPASPSITAQDHKIQEAVKNKPAAISADTQAASMKTPPPKTDDTQRMTPSTPVTKSQAVPTPRPSSSLGLLATFALILAGLAVAVCAYMWQRMGAMQEVLQANIESTKQTATNAQNTADKSYSNSTSLVRDMGQLSSKLDSFDSEERVKTLLQVLEKSQSASAVTLLSNLPVNVRSVIATAEIQTQLSGSTQPLLTALQLVDKYLAGANFAADGALRNAIATDIKNIQDIPAPDPLSVANKVTELLNTFNNPNVKLPMMNEVRTKDPGLSIDVDLAGGPLATENAQTPGLWGKVKGAWHWAVDKVTYVAQAIWNQLGSLVRITPIESKDAVLLSARDGALLKEGVKLHLMGIRLSVLQRQFTQAQKELEEVQTSLNNYFDTNNAEVKEVLRQTNIIIADLNNVSIPQASATSSALAAIQSNQ